MIDYKKLLPNGSSILILVWSLLYGLLFYGSIYPYNFPLSNILTPLTHEYGIVGSAIALIMTGGFVICIIGFIFVILYYDKWRKKVL